MWIFNIFCWSHYSCWVNIIYQWLFCSNGKQSISAEYFLLNYQIICNYAFQGNSTNISSTAIFNNAHNRELRLAKCDLRCITVGMRLFQTSYNLVYLIYNRCYKILPPENETFGILDYCYPAYTTTIGCV